MPGRPASAKALRQEYAGSGEYCGTLSQIGDGNGGSLHGPFTQRGMRGLRKDLGKGATSSNRISVAWMEGGCRY